ncbi:hypothetical protein PVAP13_8NG090400 [Panicum virgatum]|uniref:Uncharacterized protein n=1 Tax=Panicum virgatum TaxID=38727 RepID=A0A8T0P3A2_PANVG|nr:hypothetical protein PVAP13_8NG090400 [Panicum virgatum]
MPNASSPPPPPPPGPYLPNTPSCGCRHRCIRASPLASCPTLAPLPPRDAAVRFHSHRSACTRRTPPLSAVARHSCIRPPCAERGATPPAAPPLRGVAVPGQQGPRPAWRRACSLLISLPPPTHVKNDRWLGRRYFRGHHSCAQRFIIPRTITGSQNYMKLCPR